MNLLTKTTLQILTDREVKVQGLKLIYGKDSDPGYWLWKSANFHLKTGILYTLLDCFVLWLFYLKGEVYLPIFWSHGLI